MNKVWLYQGDCTKIMARFTKESVDAVITDPPTSVSYWKKAPYWIFARLFEVMKPGAHLLSFGGSQTDHLLKYCLIHTGFDIVDTFIWLYDRGLPKCREQNLRPGEFGTKLCSGWAPIVWAVKPFEAPSLNLEECLLKGKKSKSWPSNVILDEEIAKRLGQKTSPTRIPQFYYISKTSGSTKPLGLVQWLLRLVKSKGECVILDPFLGSGTTAVAALREGCSCIGIDKKKKYLKVAEKRIQLDSIMNRESVKWVRERE